MNEPPHASEDFSFHANAAVCGLIDMISKAIAVADDDLVANLDNVLRHVEALAAGVEGLRAR